MELDFLILRKYRYADYNQPVFHPGTTNPYKRLIEIGKKVIIEKELDGEVKFIGHGEIGSIEEIPPEQVVDPKITTIVHFTNYVPFFPARMKNNEIRKKLLELPFYNWYGTIRPIPKDIFYEIINFCSNPNWALLLSEMSFPSQIISLSTDDLLKQNESRFLEFKSSMLHLYQKPSIPKSKVGNSDFLKQAESNMKETLQKEIAQAIVAFLNTKGGVVIVGVDDNGNILGIENDFEELPENKDSNGWQLKFRDLADKYFDDKLVFPMLDLDTYEKNGENGKTIVRINVPESPEPVYLRNGNESEFYIRIFTSSQKLDAKYIHGYINSKENWKK